MRLALPCIAVAACTFTHGIELKQDATSGDTLAGDGPGDGLGDVAAVDSRASCQTDYTIVRGTSRYRVGTGATWYAARAACEADGAHLAVIGDTDENTFVIGLQAAGNLWIGMSDHRVEGTFVWLTGTLVTTGFQSWQSMQPNNNNGEDCVEMNSGAIWNDKPCEASQAYVCECDGALLEVPPTWCVTDLDTSCDTCTDDCTLQGNTCSADQVCS